MKMRLFMIGTLSLAAISLQAQTKAADYFSSQDVQSKLAELATQSKTAGSGNAVLGDYGTHSIRLSVRTTSGGAEAHAHFDDIFVVTDGQATLTTGGTIVSAKTSDQGETQGTSIENGKTQVISKGDVVHIPAGTPHQLKIADGALFSTIVVKVKEQ